MRKFQIVFVFMAIVLASLLGACTTLGPNAYDAAERMQPAATFAGVVMDVQSVTLSGDPGAFSGPSGYGALLGGLALSRFGAGRGAIMTGLAGVGAGSAAARGVTSASDTVPGYALVVRIHAREGNYLITVIQPSTPSWSPKDGEPVYLFVLQDRNGVRRTRVIPAASTA